MRFPQNTPMRKPQPFKLRLRERGKPQTSRACGSLRSLWMSATGVHYLGSPTVGSALSGVSCCWSRGTGTRYVDLTLLHNWLNASRQYFYLHKVWIRFVRGWRVTIILRLFNCLFASPEWELLLFKTRRLCWELSVWMSQVSNFHSSAGCPCSVCSLTHNGWTLLCKMCLWKSSTKFWFDFRFCYETKSSTYRVFWSTYRSKRSVSFFKHSEWSFYILMVKLFTLYINRENFAIIQFLLLYFL